MFRLLSLVALAATLGGCIAEVGDEGDEDFESGEAESELVGSNPLQPELDRTAPIGFDRELTGISTAMSFGGDSEDPEPEPWRPDGPDDDDDPHSAAASKSANNSDD